jgi:trans-aconitate 2-methyltransferase
MVWNPNQYLKFAEPRLRPALDLLARVELENPRCIYDLGCGTGNITRLLAQHWPSARITGVDDSAEMLSRAAREPSDITWALHNLATWSPTQSADLIFSNAALHWLPNHDRLFPMLASYLASGGTLAVQMPRNFAAPSHTSIADTVREGPWREKLEPLLVSSPVAEPSFYYSLLERNAAELDIWETEYLHVLEGEDPVKEWTNGTWLKRFLDALEEPQRSQFEAAYAERVRAAYPKQDNGKTLFPFRRLFIVMRKKV